MGEWDKVEGTAKEAAGKLTGDKDKELEGEAQHTWGEAKETADDAVDRAKEKADEVT
jgi:uncharacterized protein YjbJ (UPF0337 family)